MRTYDREPRRGFPTTQWSEVARAADVDPQTRREALGHLLREYLPALRAHLVGYRRIPPDRADDLVQGFACDQLVADDLIARADHLRGRFRSFVLMALDRHVARVQRYERAEKRRPRNGLLPLPDEPPADESDTAADVFDLAWAREVVQRAIRKMRADCASDTDGRGTQVWEVFQACALAPLLDGSPAPAHAQLAQRLGLPSPQQVSNTLVTAKRMFARVLRSIISEYAQDQQEIEAELRDLWSILSRGGSATKRRA